MAGARIRDPVGIDDFSVHVPKLFISTTGEFAASRGIDPGKLTKGIGIERMAIPDKHEDARGRPGEAFRGSLQGNR